MPSVTSRLRGFTSTGTPGSRPPVVPDADSPPAAPAMRATLPVAARGAGCRIRHARGAAGRARVRRRPPLGKTGGVELHDLPPTFATTRDAVHAVACYALAAHRRARTGEIGLVPVDGGIATPPFDDGQRLSIRGGTAGWEGGARAEMTTLREVCELLGVVPGPDPLIGEDLPPLEPDAPLDVDPGATAALADVYAFGAAVLAHVTRDVDQGRPLGTIVTSITQPVLWPEHFDLAVVVELANGTQANVGLSPGDAWVPEPYVYVGPFDRSGLDDPFWNAPFGVVVGHAELRTHRDPVAEAVRVVTEALHRLEGPDRAAG